MITDHKIITTDSPDPKLYTDFMDEIRFDIHARGGSFRDRNVKENHLNKRTILVSGLKRSQTTFLLSQNPDELCDRLCLMIHEKQTWNNTKRFDKEAVTLFDKLLEYECITTTQHKIKH